MHSAEIKPLAHLCVRNRAKRLSPDDVPCPELACSLISIHRKPNVRWVTNTRCRYVELTVGEACLAQIDDCCALLLLDTERLFLNMPMIPLDKSCSCQKETRSRCVGAISATLQSSSYLRSGRFDVSNRRRAATCWTAKTGFEMQWRAADSRSRLGGRAISAPEARRAPLRAQMRQQ